MNSLFVVSNFQLSKIFYAYIKHIYNYHIYLIKGKLSNYVRRCLIKAQTVLGITGESMGVWGPNTRLKVNLNLPYFKEHVLIKLELSIGADVKLRKSASPIYCGVRQGGSLSPNLFKVLLEVFLVH